MKTSNQCNKEKRQAMKASGKVEVRLWVYPDIKEQVKYKAERLNKLSEKSVNK